MIQRFTEIPLDKLAEAQTVPEILEVLKDTQYYRVLQKLEKSEQVKSF